MKISTVIPTHNRADLLPDTLRSVLSQTVTDHEVIVVDDGSTDGTADLLQRDFPTVKLIQQTQQGVSSARNRGIEVATGEWIALLDSDDQWHPNKLTRQLAAADNDPSAVIIHTEEIWIRDGKRVNPMHKHQKRGGMIFEHCLPLCCISPSSVLLKKSLLNKIGLFDESLPACEDYDLWLRICAQHPVLFIDEPLTIKYGGHADQLSKRYWGMDRFRIQALLKLLNSGILTDQQHHLARDMLVQKAKIYLNGARKRNKTNEIRYYESIIQHA